MVVEDNKRLADSLKKGLEQESFVVDVSYDGSQGYDLASSEEFDLIILAEVIEHIEQEDEALKNISNSLVEGGRLVLSTPKHIPFLNFWDPAWVRWKFGGSEQHKHYKQKDFFAQLEKHNLMPSQLLHYNKKALKTQPARQ